jgi:hypothetical protein
MSINKREDNLAIPESLTESELLPAQRGPVEALTVTDPEPMLDNRTISDYVQTCMVDSWNLWAQDYRPFAARPFGDQQVSVGYHSESLVVIAPPKVTCRKFRVLERHVFRGMSFAAQAEALRQITLRYRVTYISIDITGIGASVAHLVKQFFPDVTTFRYLPEVRTKLVLKACDVIKNRRLEFDTDWIEMAQSLVTVFEAVTASGRQSTQTAGLTDATGHADFAWALFHALQHDPLEGQASTNTRSGSPTDEQA